MIPRQLTPEIVRATHRADTHNLRSLITLHDLLTEASDTNIARNPEVERAYQEATVILERLILGRLDDAHIALAKVGRLIQSSCKEDLGGATSDQSNAD